MGSHCTTWYRWDGIYMHICIIVKQNTQRLSMVLTHLPILNNELLGPPPLLYSTILLMNLNVVLRYNNALGFTSYFISLWNTSLFNMLCMHVHVICIHTIHMNIKCLVNLYIHHIEGFLLAHLSVELQEQNFASTTVKGSWTRVTWLLGSIITNNVLKSVILLL